MTTKRKSLTEEVFRVIEAEMRAQGISRAELARRLDVAPSRVSHLLDERRTLKLDTVTRLADALGLKPVLTFTPNGRKRRRR